MRKRRLHLSATDPFDQASVETRVHCAAGNLLLKSFTASRFFQNLELQMQILTTQNIDQKITQDNFQIHTTDDEQQIAATSLAHFEPRG
jgi:hypothetical protein